MRLLSLLFFAIPILGQKICSYHGGSEIHDIQNLKQDMSVTTNTFGLVDNYYDSLTPEKFAHLATHYPPSGSDTALLAAYHEFIWGNPETKINVLFGNGASEMIDIIIRNIPAGNWKMNDVDTQYREYNNACIKTNRKQLAHNDQNANLSIIINPNNPTGDFLKWSDLQAYIETSVRDNSYLMVDESMLFWYGPDWINHSCLGHLDYIAKLAFERHIKVVVIQSWTKIFSSTGLRIGSAVVFDDDLYNKVRELIPPWSLNAIGRDYILHSWKQTGYLERTWTYTPLWRAQLIQEIKQVFPEFKTKGADFVSWIWMDTGDKALASLIVRTSKQIGFPIRHGKQGYERSSHIRIAVRNPELLDEWFDALRHIKATYLPIVSTYEAKQRLVLENRNLPISKIMRHEQHNVAHADALYNYLVGYNATIQTIVVGAIPNTDKYLLIDGHHRMEAFSRLGYTQIPTTIIDYFSPLIYTNSISKEEIIDYSLRGELLISKATKHMIDMGGDNYAPIIILSEYTWI